MLLEIPCAPHEILHRSRSLCLGVPDGGQHVELAILDLVDADRDFSSFLLVPNFHRVHESGGVGVAQSRSTA